MVIDKLTQDYLTQVLKYAIFRKQQFDYSRSITKYLWDIC